MTICLNRSVLDFMEARIDRASFVLEFGAGGSTQWFADRCGQLLSVETSPKWALSVRAELIGVTGCNWLVSLTATPDQIVPMANGPDLVLVDCDERYREGCSRTGWTALKSGGWLVFDDAQRPRHADALAWLISQGGTPVWLVWQPGDIESARERVALAWQKP